MGETARAAIWERERRERWRAPVLSLLTKAGRWAVVRVNDDGRRETVIGAVSADDAVRLAGMMRDRCPDEDVAEGWNYLPHNLGRPERPVPADGGPSWPRGEAQAWAEDGTGRATPAVVRRATSIRGNGNLSIPSSTGGGAQASRERRKSGPLGGSGSGAQVRRPK